MWDVGLALIGFAIQCALALLGLKVSRWRHKLLFALLVVAGLVVTGIAVKRGVDASKRVEADLRGINVELQKLHAAAPKHYEVGISEDLRKRKTNTTVHVISDAEYKRRYKVLAALRTEYILSHRNVPVRLMAGIDWPPLEWINRRLAELKEPWRARKGNNPSELSFHELGH